MFGWLCGLSKGLVCQYCGKTVGKEAGMRASVVYSGGIQCYPNGSLLSSFVMLMWMWMWNAGVRGFMAAAIIVVLVRPINTIVSYRFPLNPIIFHPIPSHPTCFVSRRGVGSILLSLISGVRGRTVSPPIETWRCLSCPVCIILTVFILHALKTREETKEQMMWNYCCHPRSEQ